MSKILSHLSIFEISKNCIDEFFFSMIESGRFITAAPDKIFAQTFFEGKDKG